MLVKEIIAFLNMAIEECPEIVEMEISELMEGIDGDLVIQTMNESTDINDYIEKSIEAFNA